MAAFYHCGHPSMQHDTALPARCGCAGVRLTLHMATRQRVSLRPWSMQAGVCHQGRRVGTGQPPAVARVLPSGSTRPAASGSRTPGASGGGGGSSGGGRQPWSSPAPAPFTPVAACLLSQAAAPGKRAMFEGHSGSRCPGLAALPSELLLRIVQLSALPMSAWMPL